MFSLLLINDINIQTAEYFNIDKKRLYFNWKELLEHEKDKIDAIVILTPTPSHYEILEETIKNQYAIICEKALVSSVDEGKKVKQLIHKYKNFLTVTFNYTGYPMIRELKNMINKGLLGDINQIHIEMPQETFIKVDKNARGSVMVAKSESINPTNTNMVTKTSIRVRIAS